MQQNNTHTTTFIQYLHTEYTYISAKYTEIKLSNSNLKLEKFSRFFLLWNVRSKSKMLEGRNKFHFSALRSSEISQQYLKTIFSNGLKKEWDLLTSNLQKKKLQIHKDTMNNEYTVGNRLFKENNTVCYTIMCPCCGLS